MNNILHYNQNTNSRSTKTKVKSKILPSGQMVEQTVVTEVTETFTSAMCLPGLESCHQCVEQCHRETKNSFNIISEADNETETVKEDENNQKTNKPFSSFQKLGRTITAK